MYIYNLDCQDISLNITHKDIDDVNNKFTFTRPINYIIQGLKHNFHAGANRTTFINGYMSTEMPNDIWEFFCKKYAKNPVFYKGIIYGVDKEKDGKAKMHDLKDMPVTKAIDPLYPDPNKKIIISR